MNRRIFLKLSSGSAAGVALGFNPLLWGQESLPHWDPDQPLLSSTQPLTVQPLFMYRIPEPKPQTSWKSWGGIQTEAAVEEEVQRITRELTQLAQSAEFPLRFLPVAKVKTNDQAAKARDPKADVVLVYACTGSGELLTTCLAGGKPALIFVRHRSGPVYYWYEALSVRFLDTHSAQTKPTNSTPAKPAHVDDVVVDDYQELRWRLRALSGVKNLTGTRIVALGGAWGKYAAEAPQIARDQFKIDIIEVAYTDFATKIERARADRRLVALAEQWTERYLKLPNTRLKTEKPFVVNAFILYHLFKEMMREHNATVFTVKSCMGTIIPMAETTACLSLGLLNDEGLMAFCESDFVIIPAGILLRHIAGKPVFLHNSTFPHQGLVTCAHCTAPRRMDGRRYEPVEILTHYESEYGAAPKVEMPIGQRVTFLDPEYAVGRWVGFQGEVQANPFYAICRSQQDVKILGSWAKLKNEVRDSHWLMVYGDYVSELGYAARKLGLQWEAITES